MSAQPSATASLTPNPTTPAISGDLEWITAYLTIHRLSTTSWRYAYLLWIVVGVIWLAFTVFHWAGLKGGVLGAYWSKWALRRRTWRKKHSLAMARRRGEPHKQPLPFPSNAQILCLMALVIIAFALTFAGPDDLAPGNKLWQFSRRDISSRQSTSVDYTQLQPQYTISKAWWTSGNRAGLISMALFPLCILFILKAPPFALFAIPFFMNLQFDKMLWLHRWCGRLIWLLATLHTAFWSVQLAQDTRAGTGKSAYTYAWQYPNFIYAWTSYGALTLLVILSLRPVRERHYEAFYFLHILFVPLSIVMAGLHHPPVWWWCWAALALWIGERVWRGTRWLYMNGFIASSPNANSTNPDRSKQTWEMHAFNQHDVENSPAKGNLMPRSPLAQNEDRNSPSLYLSPRTPYHAATPSASSEHFLLTPNISDSSYIPPTGYAHADLVAGRTIRIRLATPGYITWAPGQHFLLCIPSVSRFLSHPFTSASISDEQVIGEEGRIIVLLIRAKSGWTKDLWDTVIHLIASGRKHPRGEVPAGTTLPSSGVLLRSWVDGPFGSSVRTNWGDYSSILIVSGGSGVSFGLSILEYVCLCLAGRDGRFLGGTGTRTNFLTKRVRFVWLVREFSHIQWCATVLRRCMSLVPRDLCQIDIFVTNFKLPAKGPPLSPYSPYDPITPITPSATGRDELAPPKAGFMTDNRRKQNRASVDSDGGQDSDDSQVDNYVDLSYYTGEFQAEVPEGELGHEEDILDLTNFDGDNDERMPGEAQVNRTVRKEGKMRRALTRKGWKSKSRSNLESYAGDSALKVPSSSEDSSSLKSRISDSVKLVTSRHGHGHKSSEMDLGMSSIKEADELSPSTIIQPSPRDSKGSSITSPPQTSSALPEPGHQPSLSLAIDSDARSVYSVASDMRDLLPQIGIGAHGVQVRLEVDDREMHDISVMAEFARPGRPKLDLILKDEVAKSIGSVVVACCGPTTLNAVVRKLVAAQIDPARVRRGDMSGSISFVAEDFAY